MYKAALRALCLLLTSSTFYSTFVKVGSLMLLNISIREDMSCYPLIQAVTTLPPPCAPDDYIIGVQRFQAGGMEEVFPRWAHGESAGSVTAFGDLAERDSRFG
jgi:hypothetical protein